MNRLESRFNELRAKGEKALIIYLMAGDPNPQDTEALVLEMEQAGADIIELGVPFSDPIADGPVIQQAAERALRSGTSLRHILETVAHLRAKTQIPLVLMAYYNTIYAMGLETFCRQAVAAGVDGLIVPDMPPEEAGSLEKSASKHGLSIVFLLAPTSTDTRRAFVARRSRGFVYYVSLTGITGSKLSDMEDVRRNVAKIRQETGIPVAVGFGIATPQDACDVAKFADGVIVGSAIVRQIAEFQQAPDMPVRIGRFVQSLKQGMRGLVSS